MEVQVSSENSTVPFIRNGPSFSKESETIIQDAGRSEVLEDLTLMAEIPMTVISSGVVASGNTGNGTMTLISFAAEGGAREGEYSVECIVSGTNTGTFKLEDPDGNLVANSMTLLAGAGLATEFVEGGFEFTLTDGSTDFVVGDIFTFTTTVSGKWTPFDEGGVGGAQIPTGVYLGGDILAATLVAADVADVPMLIGGCCTIDENQLVIEGTATLDSVLVNGKTIRSTLYELGIFSEDTVDIDSFENS